MKKTIIILLTFCCLVVALTCFTAFSVPTVLAESNSGGPITIHVTGLPYNVDKQTSYFYFIDAGGPDVYMVPLSQFTQVSQGANAYLTYEISGAWTNSGNIYMLFAFDVDYEDIFVPFLPKVSTLDENNPWEPVDVPHILLQNGVYFPYDPYLDTIVFDFTQTYAPEYIDSIYTQFEALSQENTQLHQTIVSLENTVDSLQAPEHAFATIGQGFAEIGNILSIEVFPNITIGFLVGIPLIFGVVFFILRLVRGE